MGRVLKLADYRKKVLDEPGPDFTDEQLMEFIKRGREGIEEAMEMMVDRTVKRVMHEASKQLLT